MTDNESYEKECPEGHGTATITPKVFQKNMSSAVPYLTHINSCNLQQRLWEKKKDCKRSCEPNEEKSQ